MSSFFPVQLVFVHLKKNLVLILYWLILFALILQLIGSKYGVPYLFLFPEYLGKVGFLSHLLVGLSTGSFIMAFNISSYVVNGFRFSFLATLSRPFIKYCQNNFIIPLTFTLLYCASLASFQLGPEELSFSHVIINLTGFLFGNALFILLTALYFMVTNKSLKAFDQQISDQVRPVADLFSNKKSWQKSISESRNWMVVSYISRFGSVALARDSSHYKKSTLEKVFRQNRINASFFQLFVLSALFTLGWIENKWMMILTAASFMLFFTILIMLTSAVYSWFRGWTAVVIMCILVGLTFLTRIEKSFYQTQAYGLNYSTEKVLYTQENIRTQQENDQTVYLDVEHGLTYLQNWKAKTGEEKPVAVFLNIPGGGLRSALWTMVSVDAANNATNGDMWKHLVMINGSSGGMIGASYLREYYYRTENGLAEINSDQVIEDISADKLNPVAATAVLHDLFFRFKKFKYGSHYYTKDRGYAFEQKLNADTRGWLDRRLSDYAQLELRRDMPLLILSPTISNDGRKLIVSSQPVSYLCHNNDPNQLNENIEFRRFFKNNEPDSLSFLSALRMSATFPYVFPAASLPTNPSVEVLDAGIRDNYGMSNTLNFIYFFREWLLRNTSGIVLLQIRDQEKFIDLKASQYPSLADRVTQPFGTFYNTVLDIQDYQLDASVRRAKDWYNGEIEVIEFILNRTDENPISLSWHLTSREKNQILESVNTNANQDRFERLAELLNPPSGFTQMDTTSNSSFVFPE